MKKQVTFLLIFIILSTSVLGLGISPAVKEITLKENTHNYKIRIVNEPVTQGVVNLNVQGSLSEYVSLDKNEIVLTESKPYEDVEVSINVPENKQIPGGAHEILIKAALSPENEGNIFAQTNLISKLNIRIIKEGVWPIISFYAPDFTNEKQNAFSLEVENAGLDQMQDCSASVNVFTQENLIINLNENLGTINSSQQIIAFFPWTPANKEKGGYSAKGRLVCESIEESYEKQFNLGKPNVSIKNVFVKEYFANELINIGVNVESDWPKNVSGASLSINLKNGPEIFQPSKSQSFNVQPDKIKEISLFIDISDMNYGEYVLEASINFNGKTNKKNYDVVLTKELALLGDSSKTSESAGLQTNFVVIVLIVVIFAVLLSMIIIYYKYRKI